MRRLVAPTLAALLLASGCSATGGETAVEEPTDAASSTSSGVTPIDPGIGDGSGPDTGQPPADEEQGPARSGAVPLGPKAPCGTGYSAAEVGAREFAFSGTITSVEGDVVTFEPDEWYAGDRDLPAELSVGMAPDTSTPSETAPAYGIGDRLLVSGDGTIAWGCGFTRYFDADTAAAWRSAS